MAILDTNADATHDMEAMWREAQAEFSRITGENLNAINGLAVDQVIARIEDKKTDDELKVNKHSHAKTVLSSTVSCLSRLGAFVAQGASMAFPAAGMCFSAISLVINAAKDYAAIFAGLADLFDRITAFLDRFAVHMEDHLKGQIIDIGLRKILHKVLRSFVRVCGISHKLSKSKRSRVKAMAGVFCFGADQGVRDELSNFERIVIDETRMSVTQTLSKVSQSARDLVNVETKIDVLNDKFDDVVEVVHGVSGKLDGITGQMGDMVVLTENRESRSKRKDAEDEAKKQSDKIRKAFNIDTTESWRRTQSDLVDTTAPLYGKWLFKDQSFAKWANMAPDGTSILALQGKSGFGKSHLAVSVLRYLRRQIAAKRKDVRCSVAFHHFQKERKDQREQKDQVDERDGRSLNKAVRNIIWQLASNDIVYRKSVARTCELAEVDTDNPLTLWTKFIVEIPRDMDANFYILLEGLDEMDATDWGPLLSILQRSSMPRTDMSKGGIHLLLTGRQGAFDNIKSEKQVPDFPIFVLGEINKSDIVAHIKHNLNAMETFKATDDPDLGKLRKLICRKLADGAQGDFEKVDFKIEEIRRMTRPSEIIDSLDHAAEDRVETIVRIFDELKAKLSSKDIEDLEEVLTWVIGAFRPLTVNELEDVLLLKNHEKALMPLKKKIRLYYDKILEVPGGSDTVLLWSKSIEGYLQQPATIEKPLTAGAVHEAEINIVKHFLRSVCDADLFKRFGFEEFLDSKQQTAKSGTFGVNATQASLKILMTSLECMVREDPKDIIHISSYSYFYFYDHLAALDPETTDPDTKRKIGFQIYRLFHDTACFDRFLFDGDRMRYLRWQWIYSVEAAENVIRWLKDSTVVSGAPSDEGQNWLREIGAADPASEEDLLTPMTVRVAYRWTRQISEYAAPAGFEVLLFLWLFGYVIKMQNRKNGKKHEILSDPDLSADDVYNVERHAMTLLQVESRDALWQTNIASTLEIVGFLEAAQERYKLALALDPEYWRAEWGLAQTYALQGNPDIAIDVIEKPIARFRATPSLRNEYGDDFYFNLLLRYARFLLQAERHGEATVLLKEILTHRPDGWESSLAIIDSMWRQKQYSQIVDFLRDLGNKVNLNGLFHYCYDDDMFHLWVGRAARKTDNVAFLKKTYAEAIESAEQNTHLFCLRHRYGIFLYEGLGHVQEAQGFWWRNVEMSTPWPNHWSIQVARTSSICRLSQVYLQKACASKDSSAERKTLERLVALSNDREEGGQELFWSYPSRMLARYYSITNQDSKARSVLRGDIKNAVDLLSDEDPENDWQGYKIIAFVLKFVNDDVNCSAAWSLLGPHAAPVQSAVDGDRTSAAIEPNNQILSDMSAVQNQTAARRTDDPSGTPHAEGFSQNVPEVAAATDNSQQNTGGSTSRDSGKECITGTEDEDEDRAIPAKSPGESALKGDLSLLCDGECDQEWSYADDIYDCRNCCDVQLCPDCWVKLRNGTLERRICGKDHDHFHVKPWDPVAAALIPSDHVKVGDEVIKISEWLDRLRELYLPQRTAESDSDDGDEDSEDGDEDDDEDVEERPDDSNE